MTPLETILIGLCAILLLTCVGLAVLYRHCARDSVRLLWYVTNDARMFYRSGFLRWKTELGWGYEDINGSGYQAAIDRAMEVTQ